MRLSGLLVVATLVLASAIAGCSETKTPETADNTDQSKPTPNQPVTGRVGARLSATPGTFASNPDANQPAAINSDRPQPVDASSPSSVHDLTKPELESHIAKLSVYQGGDTSTPPLGLSHFLQALKRRDTMAVEQLLTSVARVEAQRSKHNIKLAENPPFSEQAQFKFGQIEFIDETKTGAYFPVMITDYDADGEYSEEIIWVLGRDDNGWRVAGYTFELFKDEPWLVLNFEDLEEVRRMTQRAEAEIRRRAEKQVLEARRPTDPDGNQPIQPRR